MATKRSKLLLGILMILLGLGSITAGILWAIYNVRDDYQASEAVASALVGIDQHLESVGTRDAIVPEIDTDGSYTPPPEEDLPEYLLHPDMPMPTIEIDGHRYIGTVSIPVLGLELPVMETWSNAKLKRSPCCYSGSVYMRNIIIAAHNYPVMFRNLKELQVGDEVMFTDIDGNIFHYQVIETTTIEQTHVEEMMSGDWDLTLFTCATGGISRVTVRCMLMDVSERS